MAKNYVAQGNTLDYTASENIASGAVVSMPHCLGIAITNIASGEVGAVAIEGVFELPKVSGAVFGVGEKLIWDDSAGAFDDSSAVAATDDLTGAAVAVRVGLNGETTCLAKLTPTNVTRTA